MKTAVALFTLLVAAGAAHAQGMPPQAKTWRQTGASWQPIYFTCDLPDHVVVMDDAFSYFGYAKLDPSLSLSLTGAGPGCAAGSCYHEFFNGSFNYRVVTTTWGIVDTALRVGRLELLRHDVFLGWQPCRLVLKGVAACTTDNRTAYVSDDGAGGYTYQAFDFGSGPGPDLALHGGTLTSQPGGDAFRFQNGSYTYVLHTAPASTSVGFAWLEVWRSGVLLKAEDCLVYSR